MATSEFKSQSPFRAKGQTTCIHHRGKKLDVYCEKCQELACIKCLSTVHKSHTLCDLNEITGQQINDIRTFIDKTENVDLLQIDQYMSATDTQLKDNASHFENLSRRLMAQTNKLKEDLDMLTAQTLSLYEQMAKDNTKLLQTFKRDLKIYRIQLKQQLEECKIAVQRGCNIQIYDAGCEIHSPVTPPTKPTLGTASFSPNQQPLVYLEHALGEMSTSGHGQGEVMLDHDWSLVSSAEQGLLSLQQHSNLKDRTPSAQQRSTERQEGSRPSITLLPQTKVLRKFKSPCNISSVCPTADGQVWISDNCTLTLLNRKGKATQEVKHSSLINDISLSPTDNTLWVCDKETNITELVSGRLVHRFSTRDEPRCICVTTNSHVIIGMDKYVSKFTAEGRLVLTTLDADTGKLLEHLPHRVSECPVTQNIAVAFWDETHDGVEGKPNAVVMDTNLKEIFAYGGEVPPTYLPDSVPRRNSFVSHGVVYDSMGNLIIGDRNNKRVLLISGRGEFLKVIHTDSYWTQAIGVDRRKDVVWAVFGLDNVKLLQYSSS